MAQRSNRRSGSLVKNVVFDTAIFVRPGARGTHLGQGLSPETGYVDADQHAIQFYPCRRGGPYVFMRQLLAVDEFPDRAVVDLQAKF